MAVRGNSGSARTTRWDVLVTNLKPSVPDMPYVADDVNDLEAKTILARLLTTRQEDLRSQARQVTAELDELLNEGDAVRARLGATLKGKFGFTDVTLTKYGFKPIPKTHRKKGTPPPPEVEVAAGTAKAGTTPAEPAPPAVTAK